MKSTHKLQWLRIKEEEEEGIDYSHRQQRARFPKWFYCAEKRDTKQLTSYLNNMKLQILLHYKLEREEKREEYCKE